MKIELNEEAAVAMIIGIMSLVTIFFIIFS